jgi:hypothetical protein
VSEFAKRMDRSRGYSYECKQCVREYNKKWYQKNKDRHLAMTMKRTHHVRNELFERLGGKCIECGDTNIDHFCVSYIDRFDRLGISKGRRRGAKAIAVHLSNLGWPEDKILELQLLCMNCSLKKQILLEGSNLSDGHHAVISYKSVLKLEKEFYEHYKCKCSLCDVTDPDMLTFDHINGDGAERRRNGELKGRDLMRKMRRAGWPPLEDYGLRILCCNCNYTEYHKRSEESDALNLINICDKEDIQQTSLFAF